MLLVLGIWIGMWLLRPRTLPPHFDYFRLRLRGQLSILFKHRRWGGWEASPKLQLCVHATSVEGPGAAQSQRGTTDCGVRRRACTVSLRCRCAQRAPAGPTGMGADMR